MKRVPWVLLVFLLSLPLGAQTDETIFREFQFDFSTPGARANGMGRAFVALSDEATAAYNNPAGLAVLRSPELSFEYRSSNAGFDSLQPRGPFNLLDGNPRATEFDINALTFGSFSISKGSFNFAIFYVNHLDYRRQPIDEFTLWEHDADNYYTFVHDNKHDVRQVSLDTFGLSVGRDFGKLSLGISVGLSRLSADYQYFTLLSSDDILLFDRVESNANAESLKPTYVLGALYRFHPKLNLALSYKRQPLFTYEEFIRNNEFNSGVPATVRFKIPDSFQAGLAYQPNDFWTLVFEIDWVQYQQLSGNNFTILSAIDISAESFFRFEEKDFKNGNDPGFHFGVEYLLPRGKNIFAFRGGGFTDPDHKTRFVGRPGGDENPVLFDIQDFLFNTGTQDNAIGYTLGLGYVRNNRWQLDVAYVKSDRFEWAISSFLYRF